MKASNNKQMAFGEKDLRESEAFTDRQLAELKDDMQKWNRLRHEVSTFNELTKKIKAQFANPEMFGKNLEDVWRLDEFIYKASMTKPREIKAGTTKGGVLSIRLGFKPADEKSTQKIARPGDSEKFKEGNESGVSKKTRVGKPKNVAGIAKPKGRAKK